MQAFLSVLCEICLKVYYPLKYKREMFTMSDGGTIALDWVIDHDGEKLPKKHSRRPILACFSGLSGGNDNLYLYSMMKEAMLNGFKCVVVNFRGSADVPLTSPKIYWLDTWKTDI
jgi:predicted alpha/beta-fold hydrolase